MMKFLLVLVFWVGFLEAAVLNSIAVVVEKEPITRYDLEQVMKISKLSREQALRVLIEEKLEISQMKRFGIVVNELEIDGAISKILKQSGMNLKQFKASLGGQSYEQFRSRLKKDLEKRKLYEQIANLSKADFSDEGARKFFEAHKEKFTFYTRIGVKIYRSNDQNSLESIKNSKGAGGNFKEVLLDTHNADPRLLGLLSGLRVGEFSPVLNGKSGYELYEVRSKNNPQSPDFEQIKERILSAYVSDQKQNFVQDYFNKLRSNADIEYF